jgi:hypothetical protein
MRRCPCCNLPVRVLGRIVSATSDDGQVHGVVGVCHPCAEAEKRLPKTARWRRINRAVDKALADPAKYLCTTYDHPDQAILAHALAVNEEMQAEMLQALGWMADTEAHNRARMHDHGVGDR